MIKKISLTTLGVIISTLLSAQAVKLTDYLLYPRLDSIYWEKDYQTLNDSYSKIANRCQTCVFIDTDTLRGRSCFNTTLGHVQLDTNFHNFLPEKLIGEWDVLNFGTFEITDSILAEFKSYYRSEKILEEVYADKGFISFTAKRVNISIPSMSNQNKRYKIEEGKFLTSRQLNGYCGSIIIGLTKEGLLILDDHTFKTQAKKDKYMVVKTSVKRIILKKRNNI